jgi:hypothetical protein
VATEEIKRDGAFQTLTIANGATTSDAVRAAGFALFGLVMPSSFTGTTLTFTVSHDGTTYQALYDNTGTAVSLTVAASRSFDLPTALASWPYFKVVSGSSEGAARTLQIVKKG